MNYSQILNDNKDNTGLLASLVNEINAWDSSLEYLEVYEFSDNFFDMFFESKPGEAARAVYFGSIENWMDEYIRFNGYGNLESLSDYQRDDELRENADEIIKRALELADDIDIDWAIEGHCHTEEAV